MLHWAPQLVPLFFTTTLLPSVMSFTMAYNIGRSNKQNNKNVSLLLDSLLQGYNHHVRPGRVDTPTDVYIDIEVRSMGPVSEVDMTYSMDCYFRQSWMDRRLAFRGSMPSMTLSISMLQKIWRPDTSFLNGKHSYLHTITQPNKFVRLAQDGTVLYSSRLTVSASCPMNLEKFPMDTQRCPLRIGSSGYPAKEVMFRWNPKRRVVIASDMKLNQFDLVRTPTDNQSDFSRKEGPFAMLLVSFQLKRHMGYFLIEVYAPCTLLVVLSWVSFWINREATADRIALGVTTILTMTFLALESRNDLPKVPYCTALDYYVAIGFGFVFATIVEFAIVHYFTKVGSGEFYYCPEMEAERLRASSEESCGEESGSDEQQPLESVTYREAGDHCQRLHSKKMISLPSNAIYCTDAERSEATVAFIGSPGSTPPGEDAVAAGSVNGHLEAPADQSACPARHGTVRHGLRQGSRRSVRRRDYRRQKRPSLMARRRMSSQIQELWINSVSKVDRVSRVVFPLAFIVVNTVYWLTYFREDDDS
ncbi:gamma-aminobutyric acid receptor alpha-like [Rhipicephalus sanguineus]|nr:gamma-aminobutyric acid receptor alpha-like [Rhipicephalus sanguineus]